MTLVEMVRKTRDRGHRFIAVDGDGSVFSYYLKPFLSLTFSDIWTNYRKSKYTYLCGYCKCSNWEKSLIDVRKIKVV